MSVPWHLRLARLVLLATILCGFPGVLCVCSAPAYGQIPPVPDPTCAGCGARGGAHRPGCPYGPTAPRPSSMNSSSTRALIAGTLMQSFLDGFNSANANAQQAELDRQLAEQQRLLEEQRARAARFLAASHLREFWDGQDRERSASLSGLLGVPPQGTALFGIPPNPSSSAIRDMLAPVDPFANDPNVVDLRGVTNPTPALIGAPAGLQQGAAYVPPSVTPSQAGVRQGGTQGTTGHSFPPASAAQTIIPTMTPGWPAPTRPGSIDWAGQGRAICRDIIDILFQKVIEAAPGHWQAELIASHGEKMNSFIENLFETLDAERLVGTLANGTQEDYDRILEDLEKSKREATTLGVTNSPVEAEHLEAVYQWLHGKPLDMKELGQWTLSSVRQLIVEKQLDHLVWGAY